MEPRNMCYSVLLCVVVVAIGASAETSNSSADWMDKITSVTTRALHDCEENKAASSTEDCLKSKALRAMDRALKAGPLSVGDDLTLVKLPAPRGARALPALEESSSGKQNLEDLLAGRAERLLETRALQVPLASLLGMDSKDDVGTVGYAILGLNAQPYYKAEKMDAGLAAFHFGSCEYAMSGKQSYYVPKFSKAVFLADIPVCSSRFAFNNRM